MLLLTFVVTLPSDNVKLMKQRKSENADNTKQNKDYELVCLTYTASGKVVKRSMYLFCHYVITKIRQMKKRKSEKKDDT
ncbi:hypothetical protein T06_12781 [Trichinella sp. T6]|nr:hypothetical protein T06_12781 [Trichinella sp. T6]